MKTMIISLLALVALPALGANAALQERRLGMVYYEGKGAPRNIDKAVAHLSRAVELGDAEAAIRLGKMYEYGIGVKADETEAALWYTRGAELGSGPAQFEASIFYYRGRGVARDPVEAVKWWTLALDDPQANESVRESIRSAEAKLSPEEIARGQALAQAWRERRTPSPARKGS